MRGISINQTEKTDVKFKVQTVQKPSNRSRILYSMYNVQSVHELGHTTMYLFDEQILIDTPSESATLQI